MLKTNLRSCWRDGKTVFLKLSGSTNWAAFWNLLECCKSGIYLEIVSKPSKPRFLHSVNLHSSNKNRSSKSPSLTKSTIGSHCDYENEYHRWPRVEGIWRIPKDWKDWNDCNGFKYETSFNGWAFQGLGRILRFQRIRRISKIWKDS